MLQKEGISLPSHYPLTKNEERELKRIRRKIRNKISAQDSRKRKKEYVDGLEDRVKQCHEENVQLLKRINDLQKDNQSLVGQVKRLQAFIQKENKSAQPTTCLLVLLLSLALVTMPNLHLRSDSNAATELAQDQDHQSDNMFPLTTGEPLLAPSPLPLRRVTVHALTGEKYRALNLSTALPGLGGDRKSLHELLIWCCYGDSIFGGFGDYRKNISMNECVGGDRVNAAKWRP